MATIPAGTKFIGIGASVPTPENKSSQNNSFQEVYTLEDLQENVLDLTTPPDEGDVLTYTSGAPAWAPAAGGSSYTVYTALLTQSGTNAPVATVLENTLGGAIVWTYNSVGNYTGTLAGAFTADKTVIFTNQTYASGGDITYIYPGTVNELYIETMDITGTNANDILVPICIEIRVYP